MSEDVDGRKIEPSERLADRKYAEIRENISIVKPDAFDFSKVAASEDLNLLMRYAISIYRNSSDRSSTNGIDIDFTSLLLAFLASRDPVSEWFQAYVRQADISLDNILDHKGFTIESFFDKTRDLPLEKVDLSSLRLSVSANNIMKEAEEIMISTNVEKSPLLDVRHVMGAYIYGPYGHEQQLKGWNFDRENDWPESFVSEMNGFVSPAEIKSWILYHKKVFNSTLTIRRRLSPHIATDIWSIDDQLGHRLYAYAIARFLTNDQTSPPICVSIQAPWGGGKTSLMRMIRNELDKKATEEIMNGDKLERSPTITDLLKFLKTKKSQEKNAVPRIPNAESNGFQVKPSITIWFNAWKYESTEQVWAGLADSIVRGVSNRMESIYEREWFYLRLNLRRHDIDSIRNWIYRRIFTSILQMVRPFIWASLIGIGTSIAVAVYQPIAAMIGIPVSAIVGAIPSLYEKSIIEKEPTDVGLGKNVKVPDYREKVGFIHNVVEDLQIIFDTIPEAYRKRLVIFVDDLDRCSPTNVAEVMEGINLFLAGDFKYSRFVLGIDPEMVAASLAEAHKDVISRLPRYFNEMPIGWRFMDKFVQLPIVIPPIGSELSRYVSSLFLSRDSQSMSSTQPKIAQSEVRTEKPQDEKMKLKNYGQLQGIIQETAHRISRSSDQDEEVLKQVSHAASYLSNNPRELKRFVNMLRFYRFLRESLLAARKQNVPTLEQLQRWIILLLKWPGLVRWLYWSPYKIEYDVLFEGTKSEAPDNEDKPSPNPIRERLRFLETISTEDQKSWEEKIREIMSIKDNESVENISWLNDENLRLFFVKESKLLDRERISACAGEGLY